MSLHFFAIPAFEPATAQEELNLFCAAHRVVSVERQFVAAGRESFWALCVSVAPGPGSLPDALKAPEQRGGSREKIDYKEVLNTEDFARFADLRIWRKATAEREGVPVYAVFSNEQLAEIVRRRVDSAAALGTIEGVGPSRVERYGSEVLERLRTVRPDGAEGLIVPTLQRGNAAPDAPASRSVTPPTRPIGTLERPVRAFPRWSVGTIKRQPARQAQPQPGFPACPELDDCRVDARPMDQALSPVRRGFCPGGKPQGARSAGRCRNKSSVPKALRVAAFFRFFP